MAFTETEINEKKVIRSSETKEKYNKRNSCLPHSTKMEIKFD
jgi:hypothetical protein